MGGEIPVTEMAVVALAASSIIAIVFRSGVVTRRASVHGHQIYPAANDFSNSRHAPSWDTLFKK